MYQHDDSNDSASEVPDMPVASPEGDQPAETAGAADSGRAGLTASFLAEIARAMRSTAAQERERISAEVADSTAAHEQKVRERGASEAGELRKMGDDDVAEIERAAARRSSGSRPRRSAGSPIAAASSPITSNDTPL